MDIDACPYCGDPRPQPFLPPAADVARMGAGRRIADLEAEVTMLRALLVELGHSNALDSLAHLRRPSC